MRLRRWLCEAGVVSVLAVSLFALADNCLAQTPASTPVSTASAPPSKTMPNAPGLALGQGVPTTLEGALWVGAAGSSYREPPKLDRLTQDLRTLPFNEFIIQVRASGAALYQSKIAPLAVGIPPQYDPLTKFIAAMRMPPKPRRVVAWFVPYEMGNPAAMPPNDPRNVTQGHPDWLTVNAQGAKADPDGNVWLEPGLPDVQQYLESLVAELVHDYPIDELYLDPMSDPGFDGQWGYHPAVLEEWARRSNTTGKPDPANPNWIAFRAQILDRALQGLVKKAHEARPGLIVSAGVEARGPQPAEVAAFPQTHVFTMLHQDWPRWIQAKIIDKVYLKNFRPENPDAAAFNGWLKLALDLGSANKVKVTVGVSGPLNESLDALSQLRRAADLGASGVALSDYEHPVRDVSARGPFIEALASSVLSPDYHPRPPSANPTPPMHVVTAANSGSGKSGTSTTLAIAPARPTSVTLTIVMAQPTPDNKIPTGAGMKLPPPPTPATAPTTPIEEGAGNLLPAGSGLGAVGTPGMAIKPIDTAALPMPTPPGTTQQPNPVKTPGNAADVEKATMAALDKLMGNGATGTAGAASPTTVTTTAAAPPGFKTRGEMLKSLLDDPQFKSMRESTILRPSDQARDTLRKTFLNIF